MSNLEKLRLIVESGSAQSRKQKETDFGERIIDAVNHKLGDIGQHKDYMGPAWAINVGFGDKELFISVMVEFSPAPNIPTRRITMKLGHRKKMSTLETATWDQESDDTTRAEKLAWSWMNKYA